jgi:hypothetical protein
VASGRCQQAARPVDDLPAHRCASPGHATVELDRLADDRALVAPGAHEQHARGHGEAHGLPPRGPGGALHGHAQHVSAMAQAVADRGVEGPGAASRLPEVPRDVLAVQASGQRRALAGPDAQLRAAVLGRAAARRHDEPPGGDGW